MVAESHSPSLPSSCRRRRVVVRAISLSLPSSSPSSVSSPSSPPPPSLLFPLSPAFCLPYGGVGFSLHADAGSPHHAGVDSRHHAGSDCLLLASTMRLVTLPRPKCVPVMPTFCCLKSYLIFLLRTRSTAYPNSTLLTCNPEVFTLRKMSIRYSYSYEMFEILNSQEIRPHSKHSNACSMKSDAQPGAFSSSHPL